MKIHIVIETARIVAVNGAVAGITLLLSGQTAEQHSSIKRLSYYPSLTMSDHPAYIKFEPMITATKTQVWRVSAKSDGFFLGQVKWFARWYQYSFFPTPDTVFEKTCLRDIAEFCETETKKHRDTWRKQRAAV